MTQQVYLDPFDGRLKLYVAPTGIRAAPTSVPTGAAYTDVQTTHVLLAAKNSAVVVRFWVGHNQALASHVTMGGWIEVEVAWLDDDNQSVQSTLTGIAVSGATPQLTGWLATGLGWRITVNANHTATLAILQNAAIARSIRSRYFWGCQDVQTSP